MFFFCGIPIAGQVKGFFTKTVYMCTSSVLDDNTWSSVQISMNIQVP